MRRRGFTLIELLAVLGVLAVLLGLSVGLLQGLLRGERAARTTMVQQTSLARLGRVFRQDVHGAVDLAVAESDGATAWQLRLGEDRLVRYRIERNELVRTVEKQGSPTAEETFPLAEGSRVSIKTQDGGRLVSLSIAPPSERPGAALSVEAMLAKDHRFEQQAAGEKQP